MKYEAIESFSGVISMRKGEVREIPNEALAQELMEAKYIKKYVPNNAKELQKALDEANETIASLNNEIAELQKQLEEKTPDEVEPSENDDVTLEEDELSNNGVPDANIDGNGEQSPDATENSGTDDVTPNNDNSDEQTLVTNENNGNGEETSDANKKDSKTSNKK